MIIPSFYIIGIKIRTTNANGQAARDIPALWSRFFSKGIAGNIPGKNSEAIYCIYTGYEKDHTRPYDTVLGCHVDAINQVPEGMVGIHIEEGNYTRFLAKGDLAEGVVYTEWKKIWNAGMPRKFTADFEVYGEKAQDPRNAEVDIFIAVK